MDIRKKSETISLQKLREKLKDDDFIKEKILKTFKSRDRNSIEDFLHNKAIDFEKKSLQHILFTIKRERKYWGILHLQIKV